eukprot:1152488-Pelagomonas_calceolata.AAC.6
MNPDGAILMDCMIRAFIPKVFSHSVFHLHGAGIRSSSFKAAGSHLPHNLDTLHSSCLLSLLPAVLKVSVFRGQAPKPCAFPFEETSVSARATVPANCIVACQLYHRVLKCPLCSVFARLNSGVPTPPRGPSTCTQRPVGQRFVSAFEDLLASKKDFNERDLNTGIQCLEDARILVVQLQGGMQDRVHDIWIIIKFLKHFLKLAQLYPAGCFQYVLVPAIPCPGQALQCIGHQLNTTPLSYAKVFSQVKVARLLNCPCVCMLGHQLNMKTMSWPKASS